MSAFSNAASADGFAPLPPSPTGDVIGDDVRDIRITALEHQVAALTAQLEILLARLDALEAGK